MTMRATIINSKVSKKSATFMLANDGMGYFAYFDVPLGKQANYVKKNSIPGQKVLIEFTEADGERRLLLKSIDFIKEAKMTVKFFFNGVKVDGVLYRGRYSIGPYNEASKLPEGTITMYARDYSTDFPALEGATVENDSDTMTDYFEKDRMRIFPDSPYYADAKAAHEKQAARSKARYEKKWGNGRVIEYLKTQYLLNPQKEKYIEALLVKNGGMGKDEAHKTIAEWGKVA